MPRLFSASPEWGTHAFRYAIDMGLAVPLGPTEDFRSHTRFARFRWVAGGIALFISVTALLGWTLGRPALQSFVPGWVTMKANTALGLVAGALAMILYCLKPHRYAAWTLFAARVFASFVALMGALTVAEYVVDADLGIDQLFFAAGSGGLHSPTPGRMAVVTAVGFTLIGIALLTVGNRPRRGLRLSQPFALAAGALALSALIGHVYGAIPIVGEGHGIQIAAHTAIALLLIAAGTLTLDSAGGFLPTLMSSRAGGVLARRLMPVVIAVPLILGALREIGEWLHLGDALNGSALVAVLTMYAFGAVIWHTARALNDADEEQRRTAREHQQLELREAAAEARAEADRLARASAEQSRAMAQRAVRDKDDALALLDLILDSAPVGLAVFDRQLRYQRINPALAAISGATPEAHIGHTVREIFPKQGREYESQLQSVLETGHPISNTDAPLDTGEDKSRRRHYDATIFPVRSKAGEIIGVGVTTVETTERRKLQQQLQQAQKMEAVGQLAGGVAHDFNNVLTAIKSFSELIALDLPDDSPIRGDVKEITAAADRAAALTRHLLAFSRRQMLQTVVLDPNQVIEGVTKMLARLIGVDIRIEAHLAPDAGHVLADPGQLEQVLINLAVNARDAMPNGGTLTIGTSNITVDSRHAERLAGAEAAQPGEYVMLSVSDTGEGMDRATQARIFEPFFTTKDPGKGTGLGLSTVYGIVRQSAGYISVYSEVGQGTTFRVFLPRESGALQERATSANTEPVLAGSETILLVDDDESVRNVASRILGREGYNVLTAASPAEACEVWEEYKGPIHLLMTDLMMPDMNGGELAKRLLEKRPEARVLYTSGYTSESVVRRGMIMADVPFLSKPFTIALVVEKVREALGKPHIDG